MEIEFNLSEKMFRSSNFTPDSNLKVDDVKEFIKLLKESRWATEDAIEEINKLAGNKLI